MEALGGRLVSSKTPWGARKEKEKRDMAENTTVIEAPMPGKIIGYKVSEGAAVNEGDVVLVLEALKMENEIMSPVSGVVKEIRFKSGDTVEDGDVLMTIG